MREHIRKGKFRWKTSEVLPDLAKILNLNKELQLTGFNELASDLDTPSASEDNASEEDTLINVGIAISEFIQENGTGVVKGRNEIETQIIENITEMQRNLTQDEDT